MNKDKPKPWLVRVLTKNGVDFVVLFLAITLGFFAENFRDEYEAHESVEVMAEDMLLDMANDSSAIHTALEHARIKGAVLDSLCQMLDSGNFAGKESTLYRYSAYVNRRMLFERHASAYNLVISTGYLRYFSKESASSIAQYDVDCNSVRDLLLQERTLLNDKVYPLQQSIFNIDNFHSYFEIGTFSAPLTVRNLDETNTLLYRNYVSELKLLNDYIIKEYEQLLTSAAKTRSILIDEYRES